MTDSATYTGGNDERELGSSGQSLERAAGSDQVNAPGPRRVPAFTTAYYAGWHQTASSAEHLPANRIDYSAVTSIIHFSVRPNPDGSLNAEQNGLTQANIIAMLRAANTRGTPVLFSVGGSGTLDSFRGATSPSRLEAFTTNLVNFLTNNGNGYGGFRGYAGIDVAWTPIQSPDLNGPDDRPQYRAFINTLRNKMNALVPGSLLYASAVKEQPTLFAELQTNFDQINVTTYELAGPWPGYVTWHNSPIYSNGTFPYPPYNPLPSMHEYVQRFLAAGVPPSKLGIGIVFQGKHWPGVTLPGEAWTQPPVVEDIPFSDIMNCYYVEDKPTKPGNYHWDEQAQAAYLSIKNSPWIKDCFISFDDETAIQKKIDYAGQYHLGVFIWELGGGWRLGGGPHPGHGLPDYLLRFVKDCTRFVHDSPLIEPDPDPPDRALE